MSYLLDSNVLSELRKGVRANARVRGWMAGVEPHELFISVLTLGEIRRGIESVRTRDEVTALALDRWIYGLTTWYQTRILSIDARVAEEWGRMNVVKTLPAVDSLLAATARVHNLTVVTRNLRDIGRTGVPCLDPFKAREE